MTPVSPAQAMLSANRHTPRNRFPTGVEMVQWFRDAKAVPDLDTYHTDRDDNVFMCAIGITVEHAYDGDAGPHDQSEMVYVLVGAPSLETDVPDNVHHTRSIEADWFEKGAFAAQRAREAFGVMLPALVESHDAAYGGLAAIAPAFMSTGGWPRLAFKAGYEAWDAVLAAVASGDLPDKDLPETWPTPQPE